MEAVHDRFDRSYQFALRRVRLQFHGDQAVHLELVVVPGRIELGLEVVDEVRIRDVRQPGRLVVDLERREHVSRVVHEVEDVAGVLAGIGAVQPGQRLHGLNAREPLVDVHAAEHRLVEAGLELVGHQQDLVVVGVEGPPDIAASQIRIEADAVLREGIGTGLRVVHLARERHQGADRIASLLDVPVDG